VPYLPHAIDVLRRFDLRRPLALVDDADVWFVEKNLPKTVLLFLVSSTDFCLVAQNSELFVAYK